MNSKPMSIPRKSGQADLKPPTSARKKAPYIDFVDGCVRRLRGSPDQGHRATPEYWKAGSRSWSYSGSIFCVRRFPCRPPRPRWRRHQRSRYSLSTSQSTSAVDGLERERESGPSTVARDIQWLTTSPGVVHFAMKSTSISPITVAHAGTRGWAGLTGPGLAKKRDQHFHRVSELRSRAKLKCCVNLAASTNACGSRCSEGPQGETAAAASEIPRNKNGPDRVALRTRIQTRSS